jgi:hypothetical protein
MAGTATIMAEAIMAEATMAAAITAGVIMAGAIIADDFLGAKAIAALKHADRTPLLSRGRHGSRGF